jgi:hypothetical protein
MEVTDFAGPDDLAPKPAPGLAFDRRGVLRDMAEVLRKRGSDLASHPVANGTIADTEHAGELLTAAAAEIVRLRAEAAKSERRAITFGDIVAQQVTAMRAAVVDAKLQGPEAGIAWIENTLEGPGHLPDVAAAKAEGGAQVMFNRETAEHEAFRVAHPAP